MKKVLSFLFVFLLSCSVCAADIWSLFGGAVDETQKGDAKDALRDTAKALGWPTNILKADGYSHGYMVTASGRPGENIDKAVIYMGSESRVKSELEQFTSNGIPSTTFHGNDAAISEKGEKICNPGGSVGVILSLVKMFVMIIPGAQDKPICLDAEGVVAWKCEKTFYVVGSSDSDDNSKAVAEELYNNAVKYKLCVADAMWFKISKKLKKKEPLNTCEFLYYLRKIETANPNMKYGQVITRMHKVLYGGDDLLSFGGVALFIDGPENKGFEDVNLLQKDTVNIPKFMVNQKGEKIDIGHSYAGLRAYLNRGETSGKWMGSVNTHYGDWAQVIGGWAEGTRKIMVGSIKGAWNTVTSDDKDLRENEKEIVAGVNTIKNAKNYFPPDQKRGNDIGLRLGEYFRTHKNAKLSDAYKKIFYGQGEDVFCGKKPTPADMVDLQGIPKIEAPKI